MQDETFLDKPIDSEETFRAAVCAGVEWAGEQRLLELVLCDPHFGFWPLSEPLLLTALTAFVRLPGRKLVLLAQRYDHLRRRHPRFVRWRNDWSHAVWPLSLDSQQIEMPALLLAGRGQALYLRNADVWEGQWLTDRARLQALNDQARSWLQRAQPDLPVSVTGL